MKPRARAQTRSTQDSTFRDPMLLDMLGLADTYSAAEEDIDE